MRLLEYSTNPLWVPKEESTSRMKKFIKLVEIKYDKKFHDYWQFHQWTVDNLPEFWEEIWDFLRIIYSKRFTQVIDLNIPMEECPKWFEGARLNFAENMLRYRDDKVALIVTGEKSGINRVTYKQLFEETSLYAATLRNFGIKKGDRVSCFMSNRKEAIIAMLAVTSIGAIWVASVVGIGSKIFLSQIKPLQPKILFTVDQHLSNGKVIDLLEEIKQIAEGMPSLEKIIIVPSSPMSKKRDIRSINKSCFLENFLHMGYNSDGLVPEIEFEQMSVSDPIFIVHTSGTTGKPKSIVHGSGVLLTRLRDYYLHWNVKRDDVWLTYPPPGWSVWNGFSMLLYFGATLVVFEGCPYFCSFSYLWDLIEELKITTLTLTTRILDEIEARGYLPSGKHNLCSLRMVLAYASVVMPQSFDIVMTKLKKDVIFIIMYACTDIISSFAVTELTLPLYRGEISSVSLGVAADVVDNKGNSIIGKEGDFVLMKSVPSFPLYFWGDTDRTELREKYFSKYPGNFTMGDAAIINPVTRGLCIFGRSEETIKVKDVYFRSYEIYTALGSLIEIRDSVCVAQYSKKNITQRVVLFVKMMDGFVFNQKLIKRLRGVIEFKLSELHVPEIVIGVPDIPYNVNGKKMESLVRRIINELPHDVEMVSNPECLKHYYGHPKLREY